MNWGEHFSYYSLPTVARLAGYHRGRRPGQGPRAAGHRRGPHRRPRPHDPRRHQEGRPPATARGRARQRRNQAQPAAPEHLLQGENGRGFVKSSILKKFPFMCSGEDGGRHQIQLDGDPESDRREAGADDPPRIQNLQRRGTQFI